MGKGGGGEREAIFVPQTNIHKMGKEEAGGLAKKHPFLNLYVVK